MHPIHYSLIFNLSVLAVTGWLSYVFDSPWLMVVALLLMQHTMGKFQDDEDEEDEEEEEQPMGFTAKIK